VDNTFIELCKLAEKYHWCDSPTICECNHENFKAAFLELANGKAVNSLAITFQPSFELKQEYEDRFDHFNLRYAERVDLMSILLDTDFNQVQKEITNKETWIKVLALMLRYLENSADYKIVSDALVPQVSKYITNNSQKELSWKSFDIYTQCNDSTTLHMALKNN